MKNTETIRIALLIVALAWGSTSCKKTENGDTHQEGEKMTLGAIIEQPDDDTSKAFVYEETTGIVNVYWSTGDQLKIYGNQQSGTPKTFDIIEGAGTTSAKFEGETPEGGNPLFAAYPAGNCTNFDLASRKFTISVPATFNVSANNTTGSSNLYNFIQTHYIPMVGYSEDGRNMTVENTMSTIFLKLKGTAKVTKIVLTDLSGMELDGTLTVTLDNSGKISSSTLSGGTSTSLTLNLGDNGVQLDESKYSIFCFPVPKGAFAGSNENVKVRIYDDKGLALMDFKKLSAGVSSGDPKAYRLVEDNVQPTPLTLRYPFSVSFNNTTKEFYFSRGNLWYNDSDGSFHFEKNQWDADTKNWTNAMAAHHLGHFYWSNTVAGAVNKTCPEDLTGPAFTNASDDGPSSSFTVEDVSGKFYILKQRDGGDLWDYLIDRTSTVGTSGKKLWGMGTVNGVKGLILLPNNWNAKTYSSFGYGNLKVNSYTYSGDTWENMEYDGAVFMPFAGIDEYGNGEINIPNEGGYWAHCYYNNNMKCFWLQSGDEPGVTRVDIEYWLSIRLVSDTQQ